MEETKKTLIFVRHGEKAKKRISAAGLEKIIEFSKKKLAPLLPTDEPIEMFHGIFPRTLETLTAMRVALTPLGDMVHEDPMVKFGSNELFREIFIDEVKKTAGGKAYLPAVLKVLGEKYTNIALEAVKETFQLMQGNFGLAVGHSPIIELAAHACDHKIDTITEKFTPLSLVVFQQDAEGQISVAEIQLTT
jgi:hypothetical protein